MGPSRPAARRRARGGLAVARVARHVARLAAVLAVGAALGACEWVFPPFRLADTGVAPDDAGGDGGTNECAEGSCACFGSSPCQRSCPSGGCRFVCAAAGPCAFSCVGGDCSATGTGAGDVTLSCPGGGCTTLCIGSGRCAITDCVGGGCVMR